MNAILFLSLKIDQLLCTLPAFGSYCNLRDARHAVLRVTSVVNIFNCLQSARLKKGTGRSQRGRLWFRMKRR